MGPTFARLLMVALPLRSLGPRSHRNGSSGSWRRGYPRSGEQCVRVPSPLRSRHPSTDTRGTIQRRLGGIDPSGNLVGSVGVIPGETTRWRAVESVTGYTQPHQSAACAPSRCFVARSERWRWYELANRTIASTVDRDALDQLSTVVADWSDVSYFVRNSPMSWPIFAYQSLSSRCISSATTSGSVAEKT